MMEYETLFHMDSCKYRRHTRDQTKISRNFERLKNVLRLYPTIRALYKRLGTHENRYHKLNVSENVHWTLQWWIDSKRAIHNANLASFKIEC